jgi:hypothetical protein
MENEKGASETFSTSDNKSNNYFLDSVFYSSFLKNWPSTMPSDRQIGERESMI